MNILAKGFGFERCGEFLWKEGNMYPDVEVGGFNPLEKEEFFLNSQANWIGVLSEEKLNYPLNQEWISKLMFGLFIGQKNTRNFEIIASKVQKYPFLRKFTESLFYSKGKAPFVLKKLGIERDEQPALIEKIMKSGSETEALKMLLSSLEYSEEEIQQLLELKEILSQETMAPLHEMSEEELVDQAFTVEVWAEMVERGIHSSRMKLFPKKMMQDEKENLAHFLSGEFDYPEDKGNYMRMRRPAKKLMEDDLDGVLDEFYVMVENDEKNEFSEEVQELISVAQYFSQSGGPNSSTEGDYKKFEKLGKDIQSLVDEKNISRPELMYVLHSLGSQFAGSIIGRSFFRDGGVGCWRRMHELNKQNIEEVKNKWDIYYLTRNAADAVRERTTEMSNVSVAYMLEKFETQKQISLCDIPCGSGEVSLRILQDESLLNKLRNNSELSLEVNLQDMDPAAVSFAKVRVNQFIKDNDLGNQITVNAKVTMAGAELEEKYDLLICPGLLDYFSDKLEDGQKGDTKASLIRKILQSVKAGGKAFFGQFKANHPTDKDMGIFANWWLDVEGMKDEDAFEKTLIAAGVDVKRIDFSKLKKSHETQILAAVTKQAA